MHIVIGALNEKLYLDPGSGSFLLQILLAALLGGAFAVRIFWRRIKAFLTGKKEITPLESEDENKKDENA